MIFLASEQWQCKYVSKALSHNMASLKTVDILFPFKFDLGQQIDVNKIGVDEFVNLFKADFKCDCKVLKKLDWQNFARSYLNIRKSILTLEDTFTYEGHLKDDQVLDNKIFITGADKVLFTGRIIKIFPEQGIISIILSFRLELNSQVDISSQINDFLDAFSKGRHIGYINYLKKYRKSHVFNALADYLDDLKETDYPEIESSKFLNRNLYEAIEKIIIKLYKIKEKTNDNFELDGIEDIYFFENFRTLIYINEKIRDYKQNSIGIDIESLSQKDIYSILSGSEKGKISNTVHTESITQSLVRFKNGFLVANDRLFIFFSKCCG